MYCPKCGKYNSDDNEACIHCGADLTDFRIGDDAFAEKKASDEMYGGIKIIRASINPNLSGCSVTYRQKIQENKEFADIDAIKCPNCGSDNVQFVHETEKRGFKVLDSCCGYILLGPIGMLCGACGMNKESTTEFWVCKKCGAKFNKNDNSSQVNDIKSKAQLLFSTPDETIENVRSLIDTLNNDLTKMKENTESLNKIKSDYEEEEKQKNPVYSNYSKVSMVITLILLIGVGLVILVNLLSKGNGFIAALIVTAAWVIGILVLEHLIDNLVEEKICSTEFIRKKQAINSKIEAQNAEISNTNAIIKQLNKIKEAKDALTERNIL